MIEHGPATELGDTIRRGLYDRADDVKDDADDDQFDSAKDVCDFGGRGLEGVSNPADR